MLTYDHKLFEYEDPYTSGHGIGKPCYAYHKDGTFAFSTKSLAEMGDKLQVTRTYINKVRNNVDPRYDNGLYTVRGYYIKPYKKDQLTEEDMMIECQKKRAELAKLHKRHPKGKYRKKKGKTDETTNK